MYIYMCIYLYIYIYILESTRALRARLILSSAWKPAHRRQSTYEANEVNLDRNKEKVYTAYVGQLSFDITNAE